MPDLQTKNLPLLPLRHGVVLPGMIVTIAVESAEARRAADAALGADGELLLVPKIDKLFATVGTIAKIEDTGAAPGQRTLLVRGLARGRLGTGVTGPHEALHVTVEPVEEPDTSGDDIDELAREYRAVVESILELSGRSPLVAALREIADPSTLADTAGYLPELSFEQRVQLLETIGVPARLRLVLGWAKELLADLQLRSRIRDNVTSEIQDSQREAILRRQMDEIRRELGDDENANAASEYRQKVAESAMPDDVRETVDKEVDRFERTSEQSPEHGWIRTWLDWLTDLPWGVKTDDRLEIPAVRRILDEDHAGLEDVKDRIIEHLAVRKLRRDRGVDEAEANDDRPSRRRGAGAILALVGPPGVGKTSLGESIARALDRKFQRVALGGVRDEAEIRGHRRTYVGAAPGRIARAIKEAGTQNPVVLLDEIDKVGSDWRGDPASALLEVLDPAQNHTFRDHYLEVDLDLSDVLFIATANVLETIPAPLLDRMELVQLDGYTEAEKVAIGRDHLLPRQLERNGLKPGEVSLTDEALAEIATRYTREAGVRQLERQIGKVLRKVATEIATDEATDAVGGDAASGDAASGDGSPSEAESRTVESRIVESRTIDGPDVRRYLRRPVHTPEEVEERTRIPGVATGLAVTGAGGDVLFVEAADMPGEGVTLTGQLGDVMQESAQIALSYVRAHSTELGIDTERLEKRRFHIHFPAGAIPKDGPSAGITMTTALVSLLTGRPVKPTVGMTGEITLQGRVLPIGGVKQKVLAAHRAGLETVMLPKRNEDDVEDVPDDVQSDLDIRIVDNIADVLDAALEPAPAPTHA